MIVLIEAFDSDSGGSEGSIAARWIEAVCASNKTEKVFVLTASKRRPISPKEVVIEIELPPSFANLYIRISKHNGLTLAYNGLIYRLRYLAWLEQAARKASELARGQQIDLAIHVSFTSLMLGTRLPDRVGKKVLVGSWSVNSAPAFRRFQPLPEKLLEWANPLVGAVSCLRRKVDVIAAANPASISALKRWQPRLDWLWVPEPTYALTRLDKIDRAIYIDRSLSHRKGRAILLAYLQTQGGSSLPLRIVSDRPQDWSNFHNVTATGYLPEEEFRLELRKSRFIISTSWREGSNTSVTQAASAEAIPIVFDIAAYSSIPADAKLAIPCEGDLVANVHRAMSQAASLTESEKTSCAVRSRLWATSVTDVERLTQLIDLWLPHSSVAT